MEFTAMDVKSTVNGTERRVRTIKEVAAILGISRGSAYEAAKRGEIPTIKIGRRLVVPAEPFDRMLSGGSAS